MKKLLNILLCSLLVFALVGCGNSAKKLTAEEYGNKLKEAGLAIENVEVTTEDNDQNHLMNKPNQYTSKINFTNGSIEVFKNKEDAQARKDYIDGIGKKMPALSEMSYINDAGVLLRIDHKVTASDAQKYDDAFMKIK